MKLINRPALNSEVSLFWESDGQLSYLSNSSIRKITWHNEEAKVLLVSRLPNMEFLIRDMKAGDKLHILVCEFLPRDKFDKDSILFSIEIQDFIHRLNHLSTFGPQFQDYIEAKTFLKAKIVWGAIGDE